MAKKTNLVAVKVLDSDGSGALSQVIAGIQWAVDDATSKGRKCSTMRQLLAACSSKLTQNTERHRKGCSKPVPW